MVKYSLISLDIFGVLLDNDLTFLGFSSAHFGISFVDYFKRKFVRCLEIQLSIFSYKMVLNVNYFDYFLLCLG